MANELVPLIDCQACGRKAGRSMSPDKEEGKFYVTGCFIEAAGVENKIGGVGRLVGCGNIFRGKTREEADGLWNGTISTLDPAAWVVKNTSSDHASILRNGQKIAEFYGPQRLQLCRDAVKAHNNHEALLKALKGMTESLNSCRMIMKDQETRDLAGEMVATARALIAQVEKK